MCERESECEGERERERENGPALRDLWFVHFWLESKMAICVLFGFPTHFIFPKNEKIAVFMSVATKQRGM